MGTYEDHESEEHENDDLDNERLDNEEFDEEDFDEEDFDEDDLNGEDADDDLDESEEARKYFADLDASIARIDAELDEAAARVRAKLDAEADPNEPSGPPSLMQVRNSEGYMVWMEKITTPADAARNHWSKFAAAAKSNKYDSEFPPLSGVKTEKTEGMASYTESSGSMNTSNINTPKSCEDWIMPKSVDDRGTDFNSSGSTLSSGNTSSEKPSWDTYVCADPTPPKTKAQLLKDKVDAALIGWPWTGVPDKLVTLAPYHINQHPLKIPIQQPRVAQTSMFFNKLFNVDDVAFEILRLVSKHHDSAWKLAATCQQMWELVSDKVDIWDMTSGYFNHCDTIVDGNEVDPFQAGSVSAHLVVTPFRRPEGPASYVEQVINLRRLSCSILNFGSSLRNVHFHRIPFLSINTLALFIPQMTNLEVLGIYNCRLMHLGTALKLLAILTVDRMKGKEHSVSLDFFPNYHLGPEGGEHCQGTYGVSWDNLNLDLIAAVWSLAKRIIEKARRQGLDLESKHTMFRQWLEKQACWEVAGTLRCFRSPKAKPEDMAAMVMYHETHGRPSYFKTMHRYKFDVGWWSRPFRCNTCNEVQMGVFFPYDPYTMNRNVQVKTTLQECLGCKLTYCLRRETDHYKSQKRCIVKQWLREADGTWNTTDLRRAIEAYEYHGVEEMARDLDEERFLDMTEGPDPYDRETEERQRDLTHDETKGKRGGFLRSPEVCESKAGEHYYVTDPNFYYKWYYVDKRRATDGHEYHY